MINLRDDADNFKPKIFFPCLHKAVNILNEKKDGIGFTGFSV